MSEPKKPSRIRPSRSTPSRTPPSCRRTPTKSQKFTKSNKAQMFKQILQLHKDSNTLEQAIDDAKSRCEESEVKCKIHINALDFFYSFGHSQGDNQTPSFKSDSTWKSHVFINQLDPQVVSFSETKYFETAMHRIGNYLLPRFGGCLLRREFELIIAAMLYDPKYAYVVVEDDSLVWGDMRLSLSLSGSMTSPLIPMFSGRNDLEIHKYTAYEILYCRDYQDMLITVNNSARSWIKRSAPKGFVLFKPKQVLHTGVKLILPLAAMCRLQDKPTNPFKSESSNFTIVSPDPVGEDFTWMTVQSGNFVICNEIQTLPAEDGLGDWTRYVDVVVDEHCADWSRQSAVWTVIGLRKIGGGLYDAQRGGWLVTASNDDRKEVIEFYLEGEYTNSVSTELILIEENPS